MNLPSVLPALILPGIEVLVFLVLFLLRDRGSREIGITLRARWMWILGGVAVILGTLMLMASIDAAETPARRGEVLFISQLFYLPGILLIYGGLMNYIHLPDGADYFLYRTFIGRIYHVRYADCHSYKMEEDSYKGREKVEVGLSIRATVQTPQGEKEKKLSAVFCWNFYYFVDALEEHRVKKEKKRRKK